MKTSHCVLFGAVLTVACGGLEAAAEWEAILRENLDSPYSETRHDALAQVDASTVKGLRAIWNVLDKLAPRDPVRFDWYVREGAYEALAAASGEEATEEIRRVLRSRGHEASKEAIVYSVVWKIRKQFERDYGRNDDRKIEEAKYFLRKRRGVEYFRLVLPSIQKFDPEKSRIEWLQIAFEDKSPRVRQAAITGFLAYPDNSSIPLLLRNLEKLAPPKDKSFREWVFTRFALETLTGQYYRDNVEDWLRWWDIVKDDFSIEKRVKEETDDGERSGAKTAVVQTGGVSVHLNMKVAGEGYPLLVLPWRGYEADYFRPYFHGVEEFMKVHYVQIPQIEDFKGLARTTTGAFVMYPTQTLADALAELMKKSGLEKFAIMGHGPSSCTLAMIMAAKFPEEASHLILLNPASAGSAYGNVLENVERAGKKLNSRELENGARNLLIDRSGKPTYEPADAAEGRGMGRALFNVKFADPTSPEVGALDFLYRLPGGTETMNDDSWSVAKIFDHKAPRMPVMVIVGERDPWSPVADVTRVAGFFKRAYVARFARAAQNPFMFEPYLFTAHLKRFAAGTGIESARSDGAKSSKRKKRGTSKRPGS